MTSMTGRHQVRLWCSVPGCQARAVAWARQCWEHDLADYAGLDMVRSAPMTELEHDFDIVCLQCSQRRTAKGTEAQAAWTRQHLGACQRCRGPQVVERSDLGGISSPSRGHSVTFDAGRAGRKAGAA